MVLIIITRILILFFQLISYVVGICVEVSYRLPSGLGSVKTLIFWKFDVFHFIFGQTGHDTVDFTAFHSSKNCKPVHLSLLTMPK